MSETPWHSIVWSSYQTAVCAWQKVHSTQELPRFWELALDEPLETVLGDAARAICDQAKRGGMPSYPFQTCLVLYHLLRTRLTNIRCNRLWPEVAKELTRLSGCPLEGERCGQFFREVIRSRYEAELEDNVHFRFVRFAFDETGVGKDRSRIVRDFLEKLREASFAHPAGLNLEDQIDEFFQEYLRIGNDGDDVEALGKVLRRSGLALLRLAADVRTRGLALECSLWDWRSFAIIGLSVRAWTWIACYRRLRKSSASCFNGWEITSPERGWPASSLRGDCK